MYSSHHKLFSSNREKKKNWKGSGEASGGGGAGEAASRTWEGKISDTRQRGEGRGKTERRIKKGVDEQGSGHGI